MRLHKRLVAELSPRKYGFCSRQRSWNNTQKITIFSNKNNVNYNFNYCSLPYSSNSFFLFLTSVSINVILILLVYPVRLYARSVILSGGVVHVYYRQDTLHTQHLNDISLDDTDQDRCLYIYILHTEYKHLRICI